MFVISPILSEMVHRIKDLHMI